MKKLSLITIAAALLATSCGASNSDERPDPVVAQVLSSLSAPEEVAPATTAPPPSLPPGCEWVTELDEYGFNVEVVDCGERPEPGIDNPDWLGSESAALAAKMFRAAIVDQADCGTRVTYGELKTLVAESEVEYRTPLLEAVAALETGAAHCDKDKDAWAAAMSDAIVHIETFLLAVERNAPAPAPQEPR